MLAEPLAIHLDRTSLGLDVLLLPAHPTLMELAVFILDVSLGANISIEVTNQIRLSLCVAHWFLLK